MNKLDIYQVDKKFQIKYHKSIVFGFFIVTSLSSAINLNVLDKIVAIITFCSLIILLLTSNLKLNYYVIWTFFLLIFAYASNFWALNTTLSFENSNRLLITIIPYIYISFLLKNKEDIYTVIKMFVISKIILGIFIIYSLDITTLGNIRIGEGSLGEGWNANAIGLNLSIAAFLLVILLNAQNKKTKKVLYLLVFIILSIFILLTGSKKALFLLFFSSGMYILLSNSKGKIKNIGFISILLLVIYYIAMNIPFFYDIIGQRIDVFISGLSGKGETDVSTTERMYMIKTGINLFQQQPFLGYGINNYRGLFDSLVSGRLTYSHNNYIELLVGFGLIGTILYYFGHIYIIIKSFRRKGDLFVIAFVSIITILVIDLGLVSYYSNYIHFLIVISFLSVQLSTNDTNNKKIQVNK